MNGREGAVEEIFNAIYKLGFIIEDPRGFFHIFATGFFEVGDV